VTIREAMVKATGGGAAGQAGGGRL